jgi:hypothetical protein
MTEKTIADWLLGNDTGSSSKALAAVALGANPAGANISYPHDGDDFGRCYRLLKSYPEAARGLERLGKEGGSYWRALVPRWSEIEQAYLHDLALPRGTDRKQYRCYDLMRSITDPVAKGDRSVIQLGNGMSMRFGQ